MGFLDDLKKEASEARSREEQKRLELAEKESFYVQSMRPLMLRALQSFRELAEYLALLPEGIEMAFEFPVIGRMDGLRQQNHRINVDSTERPARIALSFDAQQVVVRRIPVDARYVNELTRFLDGQRIRSVSWPIREGDTSKIMVEARFGVHARIEIVADIESSRLLLEVYNFQKPGHDTIPVTLEAAQDSEWLDRICGFVLCKVDSLRPQRGLSDHERLVLEKALQEATERARFFEEERARAEQAEQAARETERVAGGKVKNLLTRIAPGLRVKQ